MPGPATTVASIPSDNAIFGEERGVAKAAQCVSQVCRATRWGKTVERSGCVSALTAPHSRSSSWNCTKPNDRLGRYKKSNSQLSSSSV